MVASDDTSLTAIELLLQSHKDSGLYTRQMHSVRHGVLEQSSLQPLDGHDHLYRAVKTVQQQVFWDGWAFIELNYSRYALGVSSKYERTQDMAMAAALEGPDYASIPEQLKAARVLGKALKAMAADGQWCAVFRMVDKRVGWHVYCREYANIPDDQKYDAFIEFYTRAEDGFELIKDLYSHVFSYAHYSTERVKRLRELPDGETLTIYHGEQIPSIKDHYSWTLDKNCAGWFAGRWGTLGEVWEKTISRSAAVDYIFDRSEDEVLIDFPADPSYTVHSVVNSDPEDPFQQRTEGIL